MFKSIIEGFRSLNLNPRVRRDPGIVTMPAAMLAELWESNEPDDAPGLRAMVEESIQRGLADATAGRIKRRDDWLADPSASGVSTVATFAVKWSDEDDEWVATCDLFPSLSWLAASPLDALDGLLRAMA